MELLQVKRKMKVVRNEEWNLGTRAKRLHRQQSKREMKLDMIERKRERGKEERGS